MVTGNREHARAVIFDVIENQIRNNDPPETRQTLDRLVGAGHSRAEAKRLIACVLATELFDVMKSEKPYDNARYVANLERLPELPWEEEE
ncbi:MAG TPA: hypothetical protein VKP89_02340 [Burkholderiales bacterium]|nr:hypothetical protein [Burkholderiales bacterium]